MRIKYKKKDMSKDMPKDMSKDMSEDSDNGDNGFAEKEVQTNMFRILWQYLHSDSFHIEYTEDDDAIAAERKQGFALLLYALSREMRCGSCRDHLAQHLRDNPVTKDTDLSRYVVDLHNAVNRRQKKRQVPYEVAAAYYRDNCTSALCPSLGRCMLPWISPAHIGIIVGSAVLIVLVIVFCALTQRARR
jgi:hypothetical protein